MIRYKLSLEYDGGGFVGWQRQSNGLSVQEAIEDSIKAFSGQSVPVIGAGRTDSGVHALGQVAHVDLNGYLESESLKRALNFYLKPKLIAVLAADIVVSDFHARFSAKSKRYMYRIANRPEPITLGRGYAWHIPPRLNTRAMSRAARLLIGKHDFTTFRAKSCQANSPIRTLDSLSIKRSGSDITEEASARSFLHRQVRNIVGTLKMVGEGKWTQDDVKDALAARDRKAGGPTAPAHGRYLVEVSYGNLDQELVQL